MRDALFILMCKNAVKFRALVTCYTYGFFKEKEKYRTTPKQFTTAESLTYQISVANITWQVIKGLINLLFYVSFSKFHID